MPIERYFSQLRTQIESCSAITDADVNFEKSGRTLGFVSGNVPFVDGSMLHFREYVDTSQPVNRITYVYQYMSNEKRLLFRYDNADHHPSVPTHPHHKHDGSEQNVVASYAPSLAEVLDEIERQI